jgi:hypothetical protein
LPARIRALRSKDQGWQNVPEQWRGNGAKRNDLAVAEAEPPTGGEALTDLLCDAFCPSYYSPLSLLQEQEKTAPP